MKNHFFSSGDSLLFLPTIFWELEVYIDLIAWFIKKKKSPFSSFFSSSVPPCEYLQLMSMQFVTIYSPDL